MPARPSFATRTACAADPPPRTTPPSNPLSNLLMSKSPILPLLVRTARTSYKLFWKVLMSQLAPSDKHGRYIRPTSTLSAEYDTGPLGKTVATVSRSFLARYEEPPYAVYVGVACQWCHRVLLARALLALEDKLELRYLTPGAEGLWRLSDPQQYPATASTLKEVYLQLDRKYKGRYTAPLLVDVDQYSIVSNESAHILRFFANLQPKTIDQHTVVCLRPREEHGFDVQPDLLEKLCHDLYNNVNDGVYRCGFATSQLAYEEAESNLFATLDYVESLLSKTRFLCSNTVITEADVRLFPTAFRFDAVYAVLFRACRKTIRADYPSISAWIRGASFPTYPVLSSHRQPRINLSFTIVDIYNLPNVADTCDLEATRNNYYTSLFPLNPSAIVPVPPQQDLSPAPHRRALSVQSNA